MGDNSRSLVGWEPGTHATLSKEDRAGLSSWTETTAARILGYTLSGLGEFWDDRLAVREGAEAALIARGYLARASSHRETILEGYLRTGSEILPPACSPEQDRKLAAVMVLNVAGALSWFVQGEPDGSRTRALRADGQSTLWRGSTSLVPGALDDASAAATRWDGTSGGLGRRSAAPASQSRCERGR